MSRAWTWVLMGLAAVAVAVGAFVLGLQTLDDDGPDRPPSGAPTDQPEPADPDGDDDGGTDDEASDTTAPVTGADELTTPAWVLVVSSEGDEARAQQIAAEVAEAGHPAGVLRSDDHPSLNPGFWVAYAGPYPDADAARAAQPDVQADGFSGAYLRCAGTSDECGGDQPLEPTDA